MSIFKCLFDSVILLPLQIDFKLLQRRYGVQPTCLSLLIPFPSYFSKEMPHPTSSLLGSRPTDLSVDSTSWPLQWKLNVFQSPIPDDWQLSVNEANEIISQNTREHPQYLLFHPFISIPFQSPIETKYCSCPDTTFLCYWYQPNPIPHSLLDFFTL